jgi:large subunit ribosomal protein L11
MGKAQKIQSKFKLIIAAGKANPSPPVGPALGQRKLNIMDWCKMFNEATKHFEPGVPIPVETHILEGGKTFNIVVKQPTATSLIMKKANITKGSSETGKKSIGTITVSAIKEIAAVKIVDMNANDIDAAVKILIGSAISMGLEVKDE